MPSPTTSAAPLWTRAARVIVDWSDCEHDAREETELRMQDLMEWVRTYPQRSAVHVVLRRSLHLHHHNRQIQSALQSLGCTVTMRSYQPDTHEQLPQRRELAFV